MPTANAFVFDLDGVLVDPTTKTVVLNETLDILCNLLHAGNTVGFNTGRSYDFVEKHLVEPLLKAIDNQSDLLNLFISCEKGAVVVTFDNIFHPVVMKNDRISVPIKIQNAVRNLVKSKFFDSMFFDETKLTMVSVEMNDGHSLEDFWREQKDLDKALEMMLADNDLSEKFKVDSSRIATDLESKAVGKDLGTENFIEWCDKNKKPVDKIIFFGDSKSDLDMVRSAVRHGKQFEFVFVGEQKYLKDTLIAFPVIFTKNTYEAGVNEYFQSYKF
ncbi:MAG: HAD hydrolase family protein [Candidatus Magasanikbacteria bacterium]|jgi:hydroxymethylpyrimidine pyrophosphatase-like HAD family hydrolase